MRVTGHVLMGLCLVSAGDPFARAAEPDDGVLVRMGGEAAVPLPDVGPRAPDAVIIAPAGGPALARTSDGAFVMWDPKRGAPSEVPLEGERMLAVSPAGASLLTSPSEGELVRWRIGTWKPVARLAVEGAIDDARFSLDGHHVVVASAGPEGGRRFTLFGGAVGLALKKLDRPDALAAGALALSASRVAFPVRGDKLALYSLPRFEPLREVPLGSDEPLRALAFLSETELVGVLDGEITRWDTESGKVLGEVALPERCGRLALSGDGALVVCAPTSETGAPVLATLVDTTRGGVRSTFRVPGRGAPVFDPGGLRVAFPGNSAFPIWEVTIDGVHTMLPAGAVAGPVRQLTVRDAHVVALEDGLVRAWDPSTEAEAWRVTTDATSLALLGDGRLALAGPSGLELYDPAARARAALDKRKLAAVASAGDRLALLAPDGQVTLRALDDKRGGGKVALARAKKGTRGWPGVLAYAWDGGAVFGEGRLASLPLVPRAKPAALSTTTRLAAWLGARLVVVEGDAPRIFDGGTATTSTAWPEVPRLSALAASSDGHHLAFGTADGRVLVYDGNGVLRLERVAHRGAVTALAFDLARGRLYAAGEDRAQSLGTAAEGDTASLVLGLPLPLPR